MDIEKLKHQLIVSCQALPDEPLHSAYIMSRMALAAKQGGAAGIRANGVEDIQAIQKTVDLPVIGIIKRDYEDSDIYITATIKEVKELLDRTTAEIIATDATRRVRPYREDVGELLNMIHGAGRLAMADISNLDEGIAASRLGFDIISTTMSGYTPYTPPIDQPDFDLVKELSKRVSTPVIMEGHTTEPGQVVQAFQLGAFAVVVGGAITRPQQITARFTKAVDEYRRGNDGKEDADA
ncbi:N-acetylmannosamine-6-phosphate 2-epimerase [Schleiferilactobacillus perolens]|jgi:N-acylglucosamine-6-phosphate 2-epimerase|uniref:N-acetylmannosamine-6-phosphate 2-epimerase n=1 Tax=Schleiferilactobacillus perolens TaxID=100468 RepID=UPI00235237AA|nr:N-acetylmannosamine-6-phosphate 2-epimerase [Schleiferilactobacillus perolens]MCI2169970.1 N-acetylmannosamine-6-phosphate 2-epimerase [Schleiferilactobacillus perolens]